MPATKHAKKLFELRLRSSTLTPETSAASTRLMCIWSHAQGTETVSLGNGRGLQKSPLWLSPLCPLFWSWRALDVRLGVSVDGIGPSIWLHIPLAVFAQS